MPSPSSANPSNHGIPQPSSNNQGSASASAGGIFSSNSETNNNATGGGPSRKRIREANAMGAGGMGMNSNGDAVMRPVSSEAVDDDDEYLDVDMDTEETYEDLGGAAVAIKHRPSGFFIPYYPRLPGPDF